MRLICYKFENHFIESYVENFDSLTCKSGSRKKGIKSLRGKARNSISKSDNNVYINTAIYIFKHLYILLICILTKS